MRIDKLRVRNFKQYEDQEFTFHPNFTLLIGENGSGKTSILDALAVAASIWLVNPPDTNLANSSRNLSPNDIRLRNEVRGDRTQFREVRPVVVDATGQIGDQGHVRWIRQVRDTGRRTTNAEARQALQLISEAYERDASGQRVTFPVLAYYGAGRAWLASNERTPKARQNEKARRWSAFYDCFNERIRVSDVQQWFRDELLVRAANGGQWRPGYTAVRNAVLQCIPGAEDLWFDVDRDQLVLSVAGMVQPFDHLSAGQHMMLAMVADLAIKAVKQNASIFDLDAKNADVLAVTPGIVLIDELDVHLHPSWQRTAVHRLRTTFPSIQFICTTHSPQIIGETSPGEIRMLEGKTMTPAPFSFGLDSSRILEELMFSPSRNPDIKRQIELIFDDVDADNLPSAKKRIADLDPAFARLDPEILRAKTLIQFLDENQDDA